MKWHGNFTSKGILASTLGLTLSVVACVEAPKVKSRDGEAAAEDAPKVYLTFNTPEEEDFESVDGVFEDHILEYVVKVTANNSQCAKWEVSTVKSFAEDKELDYEISSACDWQVTVALGKTTDSDDEDAVSFEAYYQAQKRIFKEKLSSGDRLIGVDLEYERTPAGGSTGLRADSILVKASGAEGDGFEDDDRGNENDQGEDDRNDDDNNGGDDDNNQGGDAVTYSGELKQIIDRSCTSCHRPGGARSSSDLTDYDGNFQFKESVVSLVLNGAMPPAGGLNDSDVEKFRQWRDGGYKE